MHMHIQERKTHTYIHTQKTHTHIEHARTYEREEVSQLRLAIKIFIRFGSAKYVEKIKYLY